MGIYTLGQMSDWMITHTPEEMLDIKGFGFKVVGLCIMLMDDHNLEYDPEFDNWHTNEFMVTEEGKVWYNRHIDRKKTSMDRGIPYSYGRGGTLYSLPGGKKTTYNTKTLMISRDQEIVSFYYANSYNAVLTCKEFIIYEDEHSCVSKIAEKIAFLKREKAFEVVMTMIGTDSDDMQYACKNTIREGFSAMMTENQFIEINRNQANELREIAPDLNESQIRKILNGKFIIGTLKLSVNIPDNKTRVQAAQAWAKVFMNIKKYENTSDQDKDKDNTEDMFEGGSGSPEEQLIEVIERLAESKAINIKKVLKHFDRKLA